MKTNEQRIAYHTRRIARWYPHLSTEEVAKLAIKAAQSKPMTSRKAQRLEMRAERENRGDRR